MEDATFADPQTPHPPLGVPSTSNQVRVFSRALQQIAMRYMRLAGQSSSVHDTLNKQEFLALNVLSINGASRMGEIAEHLGVVQSAVTPIVDRLEAQDLVCRRRSESDRRAWLVELTDAGAATVASENKLYEGVAAEILEPLTTSERDTLTVLFERMMPA